MQREDKNSGKTNWKPVYEKGMKGRKKEGKKERKSDEP
jgi:hypothetical protein